MAKNRPIPRVEDEATDRAIRALGEMVRELIGEQGGEDTSVLNTLRSADNVAIDASEGLNCRLVLDQNVTIANPTGVSPGQVITISLIQDSTGSRTASFGDAWRFEGGSKTLSTAGSARDFIYGRVESVSNDAATLILCSLTKAHA